MTDASDIGRVPDRAAEAVITEGALVRSTSALYRPYGVGRVVKARGDQAKVEFNPSVFMPPPYRSENKILSFSEMERVETPLERAARGRWDEPWRFELRVQAARFLTGNKGGQLGNARTEILPHQIFAAHLVVSGAGAFLLADEVGLGKTIEAGMVWQALAQRGDREMVEGEIAVLERLLARGVKRDRKLDELVRLIDHVAAESGRDAEEKVLIFTEYRETQRHLVGELEGRYGKGSAGRRGFLFVFVVRQRITREDGDECLFRFEPVFVTADGRIDAAAVWPAVTAADAPAPSTDAVPDPGPAFDAARCRLEETAGVWDWADDVEFLGLSWVVFR